MKLQATTEEHAVKLRDIYEHRIRDSQKVSQSMQQQLEQLKRDR